MDLPVRLEGVQAYEVFGKYVNDNLKNLDHKKWVGLGKAQAVQRLKQQYEGSGSEAIQNDGDQIYTGGND